MDIIERIKKGEAELTHSDPQLGELIKRHGHVRRKPRHDYFASLARSIIGQQVSVIAASAIYTRLEEVTQLQPPRVLALSDEQVRYIGLSRQKTAYLKDLAQHFHDQPHAYTHFTHASDQDVIHELTQIKGIGPWTAQMFLMFTLVRLDVFAPGDGGLQRAMKQLYGWGHIPPPIELEKIAELWKPYRTIASWHLWKSLENTPQ